MSHVGLEILNESNVIEMAASSPVLPVHVNFKQSNVVIPADRPKHRRRVPRSFSTSNISTPKSQKALKNLVTAESPSDHSELLRSLQGNTLGSFRKDSDRAAYLFVPEDNSNSIRRSQSTEYDNWGKINNIRAYSPNAKHTTKETYLTLAYKDLKPVLRPLPKKIERDGESAHYIGGKYRYHPRLEIAMAQQVASPYNYGKEDKIFLESKTGWFGYSPKRLELIRTVKEAKREPKNTKRKKKSLAEKRKVQNRRLPELFSKSKINLKSLTNKFRSVCLYNSPFYKSATNYTSPSDEKISIEEKMAISISELFYKNDRISPDPINIPITSEYLDERARHNLVTQHASASSVTAEASDTSNTLQNNQTVDSADSISDILMYQKVSKDIEVAVVGTMDTKTVNII